MAVVVAASRMRHPLDARTLARLAVRYAGEGPGTVVGFGLSNDERRGRTGDFAHAFDIARRAGLACVPHGGELLGADAVAETLTELRPDRLGHGVRSVEDPAVLEEVVRRGVTLEVCPGSNVALGVYPDPTVVPLRRLLEAGAQVALGADDPLLFGSRLAGAVRVGAHGAGAGRRRARGPGPRVRARLAGTGGAAQDPARRHRRLAGGSGQRLSPAAARSGPSVHQPAAARAQSEVPTRTGSLTRLTPNVSCTPSRISRARATTSAAVAPPRFVRARVCLVERAAGPGMR